LTGDKRSAGTRTLKKLPQFTFLSVVNARVWKVESDSATGMSGRDLHRPLQSRGGIVIG
jgi:hypothetical protein